MAKSRAAKGTRVQQAAGPDPALQRKLQDIGGLALVVSGLCGLLALLWPQHAPVPDYAAHFLRLIAGSGAYVIVLLVAALGVLLIRGLHKMRITHATWGFTLLFLVFVAWRHLLLVPGAVLDPARMVNAGGWLGGLTGGALYYLCHRIVSYAVLSFLALVAAVLLADQPIADMVQQAHERGLDAADRVKQKVAERRAAWQEEKEEAPARAAVRTFAPAAAGAAPLPGEREERAARIAERALAARPGPREAPVEAPRKPDPDRNSPKSKIQEMLFRKPFREEQQETQHAPAPAITVALTTPENSLFPDEEEDQESPTISDRPLPAVPEKPPFVLPPLTLLQEPKPATGKRSSSELADKVQIIERTLEQFNIGASVMEVASGPAVTRYEIQLAPGIKVSKIVSLADNLAMSLAAIDVRVEAPIPGKAAIGVEVPNSQPSLVTLRECLDTEEYRSAPSPLTIALGRDVSGNARYADLAKMPHLLIGGSTNSGKSACLNSLIASLVYRSTPDQVRLLMIDPKRVELSLWDGIPHLMHPVIKDVKLASGLFRAAIREMDRRYDLFAQLGARNIESYNEKVAPEENIPFIVIVVDELADLMMQQGPEIESSICRLAQLARATGIHLVIATQRPSVDVITGTIKANISSRIAFAVASQIDSRTILDMPGADRLIGRGDMLFMPIDASKPTRIQGCYLSEGETNKLVAYLKTQSKPDYNISVPDSDRSDRESRGGGSGEDEEVDDKLVEQAVRMVVQNGQCSTSMLQRRFRIGYTRAARIVELMEERGIVGPLNGARPREILISRDEVEQMFPPHMPQE